MKKYIFAIMFFLFSVDVSAENFTPTLLKFFATAAIPYNFDGSVLEIPFNQSGTPATVVFSVFTKDEAGRIVNIRNGNLGWHYVNLIDTCIYVASPKHYEPGNNTIYWDGMTTETDFVKSAYYTYYIWGYDDTSTRKTVADALPFNWMENAMIITKNEEGTPLTNPVIYKSPDSYRFEAPYELSLSPSRFMKWNIGDNPEDTALVESTFINEYNSGMGFAVNPADHDIIYHETYDWDVSGTYYVEKMRWVSNGIAVRDDSWGFEGRFDMTVGKGNNGVKAGVYNYNGNELLTTYSCPGFTCMDCNLVYIDMETGEQTRQVDMKDTYTWYNSNPRRNQWQNRGPTSMNLVNGRLYFGQAFSTVMACVNPDGDISDGNFWLWKNLYGDNFHDNYDDNPDFTGTTQYPYSGVQDANGHVITNADGLENLAFDLTLPDGTGAGYYKFVETTPADSRNFLLFVDSDSAYDGIYTSKLHGNGWAYIAHDSISGTISEGEIGMSGEPYLYLISFNNGGSFPSGKKFNIVWNYNRISAVKIEFSSDDGETWETVANNYPASSNKFVWAFPEIISSKCLIRISNVSDPDLFAVSEVNFTVDSSIGVEQSSPFSFSLSQNSPNPFNPATTIDFTLPEECPVSVEIFNIYGQKITTLADSRMSAGIHTVRWDGGSFSAGIYICRVKAGENMKAIKMLLLK